MRRVSNLAFSREFVQRTGVSDFRAGSPVFLGRDRENPYDEDAVGVFLVSCPGLPLGWLYRKDNNREPVLLALDRGQELAGKLEARGGKDLFSVIFWL